MLLKISKLFVYLSLLSVIVVLTSTFFPFIGGKDYFFRASIEAAVIFFVLWWAFGARDGEAAERFRKIVKRPLFIAVSVFVLVFLLASIFAYDPNGAFWSNYERGEGGFQMIHYYLFFVLLVFLFERKEEWRVFFQMFLLAATLMILYGVFAQLGWADNFISPYQGGAVPPGLWQKLVATRFQGSLGNPAYVAPYLLFSIFYALYLWVTSKFSNKWIPGAIYSGLSLFFLFFFILSKTRGAFVGLAVGIIVFLIYIGIRIRRLRILMAAIVGVLIVTGLLAVRYSRTPFIQNLPGGRLVELSLSGDSAQTRLWTWGSAWKGFKERPILGWGPENFSAVFDKYFDPRHFVPGKSTETWFDRAHSVYFDYLVETGPLGILSYLSIFAVMIVGFLKSSFRASHSVVETALIISLPIGYLAQGVAIFDVLPMYINLFAVFAFGYFCLYGSHVEKKQKTRHLGEAPKINTIVG